MLTVELLKDRVIVNDFEGASDRNSDNQRNQTHTAGWAVLPSGPALSEPPAMMGKFYISALQSRTHSSCVATKYLNQARATERLISTGSIPRWEFILNQEWMHLNCGAGEGFESAWTAKD